MSIWHPIAELRLFKILPWNSRVKLIDEVTVQSHNVGLASYRLTSLSFHVHRPPILEIQHFQNLTLKIKGQGQMTKMLHNYRSRKFHRTSNGINPSSGFKDMDSTSLAQVLPDLTSFWPMGKPISGKWANKYDSAQLHVYTSPWNFKWGTSIQRFQRYAIRKVWTQFVTNLTSFWPMDKPIRGKWANDHDSAQLEAKTIPQNFEWRKSVNRLQRYGFRKSGSRPPSRATVPLLRYAPLTWQSGSDRPFSPWNIFVN